MVSLIAAVAYCLWYSKGSRILCKLVRFPPALEQQAMDIYSGPSTGLSLVFDSIMAQKECCSTNKFSTNTKQLFTLHTEYDDMMFLIWLLQL